MRLDRSISLGLVQPAQRAWNRLRSMGMAAQPRRRSIPVLMYHSISDTPEAGVSEYYQVCTSPARFAEQMAYLASRGWRGLTLSQALATVTPGMSTHSDADSKFFALTFDDGFRDFHSAASPILQRHGFTATMYLPTAYIADQRRIFKERECLTWTEVTELHKSGFEFGSHTVNHPALIDCSWPTIQAELRDSKSAIEQVLGSKVSAFGYPYAFPQADPAFIRDFRALLTDTGYSSCATTIVGRARTDGDPLLVPRLPANSADDPVLLEAKLDGAYDWMALPQLLRKRSLIRSNHRAQ